MILNNPVKYSVAICATFLLMMQVPCGSGERILFIFPLSSKSMVNLFEPLVKGLVEKGHEVKVVTPVRFKIQSSNLTQLQPFTVEELFSNYPKPFESRRHAKLFSFPIPFQEKFCHQLYQMKEFRNIFTEKYDVVIVNTVYHDCFAGLFHQMGSPLILFSTLPLPSYTTELLGSHAPSSFVPICMLGDISAQLTFAQRTKNLLYNAYFYVMVELWTRPPLEALYKEYLGKDMPSIVEVYKKQTSLILMNSHFSVTNPRPLLPSIVEIGGIHCEPAKALPKDLEEFVAGAEDGFIVFSLGSIVKAVDMPESVRQAFVKTFAKLKQRVIWKWEKDGGMPDLPPNVKLVKWLPQQDLLGHPNIRLFITHGGLLSTEEAVYHGVPVLGMAVFIDQDANMKQAEILGFGVKGEILNLTESKLTPWVRRILDDPRYLKKAKELSKIFRDQPESPLERAVYWTEYVMRHNGAYHLRSAAMNLNLIQYHSLDVVGFLLLVVITFVLFIYYVLKLLIKMITRLVLTKRFNNKRKHALKRKLY